jgi:hypothetical protein
MWIKPEEILITALWIDEKENKYFKLQRRRGQDEINKNKKSGLANLLVATWDSLAIESKLIKYRILHHNLNNSELNYCK